MSKHEINRGDQMTPGGAVMRMALIAAACLVFGAAMLAMSRCKPVHQKTFNERLMERERDRRAEQNARIAAEVRAREQKEIADHQTLIARAHADSIALAKRWREDLLAARRFTAEGIVPPFISITQNGRHVNVTNVTSQSLCLQLARVAMRPDGGYERCQLGENSCREIPAGQSFRFQLYSAGNSPTCFEAPLEFRIGNPESPEPSWWSSTALTNFDELWPLDLEDFRRMQPDQLYRKVAAHEALLGQADRAARWRRENALLGVKPR
jgi:hypothetical protein